MQKTIKNDVVVFQLSGDIEANSGKSLNSAIKESLGSDGPNVLLNFDQVSYMNSAGLRELIDIVKYCNKNSYKLKICSLPEDIREMFEFTNLTRVFSIYDNQSQALSAF